MKLNHHIQNSSKSRAGCVMVPCLAGQGAFSQEAPAHIFVPAPAGMTTRVGAFISAETLTNNKPVTVESVARQLSAQKGRPASQLATVFGALWVLCAAGSPVQRIDGDGLVIPPFQPSPLQAVSEPASRWPHKPESKVQLLDRPLPGYDASSPREWLQMIGGVTATSATARVPAEKVAPPIIDTTRKGVAVGSPANTPSAVFFTALRKVESNGNDRAVGDNDRSRGPFQIQAGYWRDGGGNPARYMTDVWNVAACERVMIRYWKRYCPTALATGDYETLARCHNGGPAGARNPATLNYWRRVKGEMNRGN